MLVYEDRDYRCNWLGGENLSLSLEWKDQETFQEAGYEELVTNDTYVGGVVRQAGNLAFVRVFESGHYAAASQPETVARIIGRGLREVDVATGSVDAGNCCGYQNQGPQDSWDWRNEMPESPEVRCSL